MNKENRRPRVLLLGNGINRAFNSESWDSLIDSISKDKLSPKEKDVLSSMSFPIRAIVATGNDVLNGVKSFASQMMDLKMPEEQKSIIRDLVSLDFDAILTTNYSYEVEKAHDSDFSVKMNFRSKYRVVSQEGTTVDKQFGIYSYMNVGSNKIWHIHGEAAKPNSIVLGHRYYGKLISRINNRLRNTFADYKSSINHDKPYTPKSWIDYFMVSDVYIVGLGLDLSEMDLWWLLDIKQAHKDELGDSKVVWFEPNLNVNCNMSKTLLAKCYGMDIQTDVVKEGNYRDYYNSLSSKIKTHIESEA